MTLLALNLGAPPPKSAGAERRLDWLIDAMVKIDRWSNKNPASVAQGFTLTDPVENRTLDVGAASLGDLREVVGTLLADVAQGGSTQA